MNTASTNILGVRINIINYQQAMAQIDCFCNSNKTYYIVTPNPEIILAAQQNSELRQIINSADLILPDGSGLILASNFKIKKRITGIDIMEEIIKRYPDKKFKFVINKNGLTSEADLKRIKIGKIDEKNPDIIFVGLGCPDQEYWIKKNIKLYKNCRIIMTVGGGIDFLTGKQKRAPAMLQKIGLEWLWRLIKQPRRFGRIMNAVFLFPLRVFLSKIN